MKEKWTAPPSFSAHKTEVGRERGAKMVYQSLTTYKWKYRKANHKLNHKTQNYKDHLPFQVSFNALNYI